MKRIIITVLMAALLITSATACGKKTNDYGDESRVLYSDSDMETETEEKTDTESTESDTESDTEKKDSESDSDKKKDSSSKKATSSKAASSKAASSKAASSKAASSKAAASRPVTSSKAASSAVSSAASSSAASSSTSSATSSTTSSESTSSKTETDTTTNTDTEKMSDTETDTTTATDSDTEVYYDSDDTIAGSDPFDEDIDLRFSYRNSFIDLYDSMDFVTSLLGDPDEEPEVVGACATGDVMEYDYRSLGFMIMAQPSNVDGDDMLVQAIKFTSSVVKTEKDVAIGDPEEKIFEIYGEKECDHEGPLYTYYSKSSNSYLRFTVTDGVISDIIITIQAL